MKVLIAGGSGFLGTALRNLLAHNAHEVFILTADLLKDGTRFIGMGKQQMAGDP
jgi:nucleoside-diphosphate-sugar epimerase